MQRQMLYGILLQGMFSLNLLEKDSNILNSLKLFLVYFCSSLLQSLVPGFVILLDGEEHHAVRKLINPAFNPKYMSGRILNLI